MRVQIVCKHTTAEQLSEQLVVDLGSTDGLEITSRRGHVLVEMHHEQLQKAEPGDNVGLSCKGFGKKDLARGDVLGHPAKRRLRAAETLTLDQYGNWLFTLKVTYVDGTVEYKTYTKLPQNKMLVIIEK